MKEGLLGAIVRSKSNFNTNSIYKRDISSLYFDYVLKF